MSRKNAPRSPSRKSERKHQGPEAPALLWLEDAVENPADAIFEGNWTAWDKVPFWGGVEWIPEEWVVRVDGNGIAWTYCDSP